MSEADKALLLKLVNRQRTIKLYGGIAIGIILILYFFSFSFFADQAPGIMLFQFVSASIMVLMLVLHARLSFFLVKLFSRGEVARSLLSRMKPGDASESDEQLIDRILNKA